MAALSQLLELIFVGGLQLPTAKVKTLPAPETAYNRLAAAAPRATICDHVCCLLLNTLPKHMRRFISHKEYRLQRLSALRALQMSTQTCCVPELSALLRASSPPPGGSCPEPLISLHVLDCTRS